jgi:hypothetical protein
MAIPLHDFPPHQTSPGAINALIKNGVRIDHLNEFPFSPYNCFPGREEREQGRFCIDYSGYDIPLVYTTKSTKVV